MFTASNVKKLQGHIDRDELFRKETSAYQPTPLRQAWWCDPPLEDYHIDLTLGFNLFTFVYKVAQTHHIETEHTESDGDPGEADISYHE